MKVYISADIEGVAGCSAAPEVDPSNTTEYPALARQMTAEVRAACLGAFAAGAKEVWIKDAHWTGRNIDLSQLPNQGVRVIRGWSGHPYSMMQEIDGSFAAAVCIGYHSRAGSAGNPLAHTMSSRTFAEIRINERPASEFIMNSYTAYREGVPMVFLSGDEALCKDSKQFDERLVTVATMQGVGDSTINLHPQAAVAQIQAGVERALRQNLRELVKPVPSRFKVEIRYKSPILAYRCSHYPSARLSGEDTVVYESADYLDILRILLFAK